MPKYQPEDTFETLDDPDCPFVLHSAEAEDATQIDDLQRELTEDVAVLPEGEQLYLHFGEQLFIIERIGENVLLIVDWPRLGRDVHELLDHVIAVDDPAMHLLLFRGQTFLASVRRQLDVADIDRLWAVIHA